LLVSPPMKLEAKPHPKLKAVLKVGEHLLLGAAIQTGVTYAAGGPHSDNALRAGAASCLLVAGFKEGSDALAGADTSKQAFIHASTIAIGCGAMIGLNH
jgi:hypothetical protein